MSLRESRGKTAEASLDAVVFDLDGVLTDTAPLHFRAWKEIFDDVLATHAALGERPFEPFIETDYARDVDGKPRYEGVRSLLASRGIKLPFGTTGDPPGDGTVCAVGNRKNVRFNALLDAGDIEAFEGGERLIASLEAAGVPMAVASSSRNARRVLRATGLHGRIGTVVDGEDSLRDGLVGKPAPDIFIEACRRLGASSSRSVVFEDAIAGVEAGIAGGFGLVIGVARLPGTRTALTAAGAHRVVEALGGLDVETLTAWYQAEV